MRGPALCSAVLSLILLAAALFAPVRAGVYGLDALERPERIVVQGVAAHSPAAQAGLLAGDVIRLDRMSVAQRIALRYPVSGLPVTVARERPGAPVMVPAPGGGTRPWLALLVVVIYSLLAIAVAFRGEAKPSDGLAVAFLACIALTEAFDSVNPVLPLPALRFAADIAATVCVDVALFAGLVLALIVPPRQSRTHTIFAHVALLAAAAAFALYGLWPAITVVSPAYPFGAAVAIACLALSLATLAALIAGVRCAAPDQRTSVYVTAAALAVFAICNGIEFGSQLLHWDASGLQQPFSFLRYVAGIAIAYAPLDARVRRGGGRFERNMLGALRWACIGGCALFAFWASSSLLDGLLGEDFSAPWRIALLGVVALCAVVAIVRTSPRTRDAP